MTIFKTILYLALIIIISSCSNNGTGSLPLQKGYKIAYMANNIDGYVPNSTYLYLFGISTEKSTLLLDSLGNYPQLAWSWDCKYLAVKSISQSSTLIYLIDQEGNKRTLLDTQDHFYLGEWSPSNSKLLLTKSGIPFQIFTIDINTSELIKLSDNSGDEVAPKWSPDGNSVVLTSERTGNREIFQRSSDGTQLTQLTDDPDYDHWLPSWSHDGSKILYSKHKDNPYPQESINKLCVLDISSNQTSELVVSSVFLNSPSWSPDDSKILFSSWKGGIMEELFIINSDGSNETQLTNNSPAHLFAHSWLPDGSRIIYSHRGDGLTFGSVDPTGSNQKTLLNIKYFNIQEWMVSPVKVYLQP